MTARKVISFRLQSKYVVWLESVANDQKTNRTKVLEKILDAELKKYIDRSWDKYRINR